MSGFDLLFKDNKRRKDIFSPLIILIALFSSLISVEISQFFLYNFIWRKLIFLFCAAGTA
ncbi:MAG: hypothetical protein A2Y62_08115 [Candidatus Fischerbacteria bacterium RBG_13_37_8]|uniref:Uncharacterized protein n=1 Tax=Candidatus Fischerbacteria bacterium RBG_13_37_8 TaxID=1817863 RepID=A0A1F5VVF1_9BACT|nr:MAG: hypothetical protein A2Y62_08115 [Candidatus Fischerbacteria bacterium RBG_13_37_8]